MTNDWYIGYGNENNGTNSPKFQLSADKNKRNYIKWHDNVNLLKFFTNCDVMMSPLHFTMCWKHCPNSSVTCFSLCLNKRITRNLWCPINYETAWFFHELQHILALFDVNNWFILIYGRNISNEREKKGLNTDDANQWTARVAILTLKRLIELNLFRNFSQNIIRCTQVLVSWELWRYACALDYCKLPAVC